MTNTQEMIPIEDIKDNLVFLKDGSVSLLISTSAVNFGLLFETEQMAMIEGFAGFLNSLSFPIQIVVRSQRLDISSYLNTIDQALMKQANPLLAQMTLHYRKFVESLIKEKNVLDKQFYVCLSLSSIELGFLPKNSAERTKKAITVLSPRRDHVIRQLQRIGLKAVQLNTIDLIKTFYSIYNLPAEVLLNQVPIVKPALRPIPKVLVNQGVNIPRPQNLSFVPPTQSGRTHGFAPTILPPTTPNPPTPPIYQPIIGTPFIVEELPDE